MSVLYLDQQNLEVRRDGDSLALYLNGSLDRRVPLRLVERVIVHGDALLHAGALTALAAHGGSVVLLPRRRVYGAALLGRGNGPDAARRLRQYEAATDAAWKEQFSRTVVRCKIRGQARLLFRAIQEREDLGKPLRDAVARMAATEREVRDQRQIFAPRLLGMEGAAAAAFFGAFQQMFAPSLGFRSRNRRPPKDPVNACLSLAYTLLHAEAVEAILGAGLDPTIGFLHEAQHGRESFACDLVEIVRPLAEEWVWKLFQRRLLQPANFKMVLGGCLLGKAGRRTYYEQFEPLRANSQRRLHRVLRAVIREWKLGSESYEFSEANTLSDREE